MISNKLLAGSEIQSRYLLGYQALWPETQEPVIEDPYCNYSLNSLGYRSKEFIQNESLVIAGCSFSFGIGVPEEMIWGTQVAKHFGLSYSNLSIPGISPMQMVQNLFAYFKEYGNPEYLIVLSPDLFRLTLPSVPKKLLDKKHIAENYEKDFFPITTSHLYNKIENNSVAKYSKSPHIIDEIIPLEIPKWLNLKHLYLLEQYCNSNNIRLAWSFWDRISLNQIISFDNDFNYLIDSGVRDWNKDQENNDIYLHDCHLDLKEIYPDVFDLGGDRIRSRMQAHFGVHKHTHISENFIKHIENNWNI